MKRLILLVVMLSIPSCATLKRPDGSINTAVVLNDIRWSVLEACSVEWLPPADCVLAEDTLTLADGIVASNLANVGPAVRQLLVDVEARLVPTSRLRPYFDVAIALLP